MIYRANLALRGTYQHLLDNQVLAFCLPLGTVCLGSRQATGQAMRAVLIGASSPLSCMLAEISTCIGRVP